jgi:hypothetical protein
MESFEKAQLLEKEQVKNEQLIIPIPLIAALIGAATTAASTAVSATLQAVGAGSPISCVVVNNTPYKMTRFTGIWEPVHGELMIAPAPNVLSLLKGATPGDTVKGENKWKENNYTTWGLRSKQSGTELLTVYRFEEINLTISMYAGNPVTGAPYAGVSVGDNSWFDSENNKKKKTKGDWMIDHIKKIHTKNCQYSKNGKPCTTNTNEIQVDFASAVETTFRISFTGDWSRFPMPNGN